MDRKLARALLLAKERSGELPVLRERVRRMSAPIWWYDPEVASAPILNNGTCCFVATGARDVMVTCNHVFEGWVAASSENPRLVCQLGGAIIDPRDHVIDTSSKLDLATFEIGAATRNMVGVDLHAPPNWPTQAEVGDAVIAGGFPGIGRTQIPFQPVSLVNFLFPTYGRILDRVRDDNLALQLELDEAFSTQGLIPTRNPRLGGASGGPVVRLNPDSNLLPFELVGFIYEYQADYELLFARPAGVIRADGTIEAATR